ncbi:succinylglutamate desuccinylase/aspartoacylase family protein [Candidatus Gracilibacteria bacterium]|nr:succinylglutamate desuccinylase/aspartoacylase family protein [Candidatus Gracilibacteria bacterium]
MHREKIKSLNYLDYFQENQADVSLKYLLQSKSPTEGSKVLFVAGVHGDETAPVAALIKLHKIFNAKPELLLKGTTSFLLANPIAFKKGMRYVQYDLNRCFQESVEDVSTIEGKRVSSIREYFAKTEFDIVLDLHSMLVGEFRLVIFEKNQVDSINYLDKTSDIGYYATYQNNFTHNSLLSEFSNKKGVQTFGIECGNNKSIKTVSVAFDQMVRTLEYLEMIQVDSIPLMGRVEKTDFIQIFDIRETIKPHPGFNFVDPDVKTGSYIKKGQIYATYKNGYNLAHENLNLLLPKTSLEKTIKKLVTLLRFIDSKGKYSINENKKLPSVAFFVCNCLIFGFLNYISNGNIRKLIRWYHKGSSLRIIIDYPKFPVIGCVKC